MISIIIPLYKGRKYVDQILAQIQTCSANVHEKFEVIFVNDYPDELIECSHNSDKIKILIHNNEKNYGIHKSRVKGLDLASGEYVMFMDQDDIIFSEYFNSQLDSIGDSDAVVCELIHDGKLFYDETRTLEQAIDRHYLCSECNTIVTPGQVIVKKEKIPEFWKKNIVKNNGADDWFLWVCLVCSNKRIVCNHRVLFEHMIHKSNASSNEDVMYLSIKEVVENVVKSNEFANDDKNRLIDFLNKRVLEHIEQKASLRRLNNVMYEVQDKMIRGEKIFEELRINNIKQVIVYGKGKLGLHIEKMLFKEGIKVLYYIDRNAKKMGENTRLLEDIEGICHPIVISVLGEEAILIQEILKDKYNVKVWRFEELLSVETQE